jgi:hypothetical protein
VAVLVVGVALVAHHHQAPLLEQEVLVILQLHLPLQTPMPIKAKMVAMVRLFLNTLVGVGVVLEQQVQRLAELRLVMAVMEPPQALAGHQLPMVAEVEAVLERQILLDRAVLVVVVLDRLGMLLQQAEQQILAVVVEDRDFLGQITQLLAQAALALSS